METFRKEDHFGFPMVSTTRRIPRKNGGKINRKLIQLRILVPLDLKKEWRGTTHLTLDKGLFGI